MTRILYAGFDTPHHSGGVHVLTQHVRLLRAAGHDAYLWLPAPRRADSWVEADLPVVSGPTLPIGCDDLLVLPETPTVPGVDPAPGARAAILNQNHFYTFAAGPHGAGFPGWASTPALWVVSRESRDVLAEVLPDLTVSHVPNPVDGVTFAPRPSERLRVTWFPKKRPREASLLAPLLRGDPRLHDVDVVELVDAPRATVAATLARTTVFVALGHSESFGLPVAEALASGCLVTGYDGGGGHELFEAPGAWRVPEQRPLLLRDRIVDLLGRVDELAAARVANRDWVLEKYSFAQTAQALEQAVAKALRRPGSAAVASHPARWLHTLGPAFTAYG